MVVKSENFHPVSSAVRQSPETALKMRSTPVFTYKIEAGDTFYDVGTRCDSNQDVIRMLNPGVNPTTLQIGQVIDVPSPVVVAPVGSNSENQINPIISSATGTIGALVGSYTEYSGPATAFPDPSRWAMYDNLRAKNCDLLRHHNSPMRSVLLEMQSKLLLGSRMLMPEPFYV